jgi:hypothetical protein
VTGIRNATPEENADMSAITTNTTDGPVHKWFSLSYCNYVVLHRTLLQSMPIEFQQRAVALFEEMDEAFAHVDRPECFKVEAAEEHIVWEMTEEQLKRAGVTADWYGGEEPPEAMSAEDLAEWREQHEQTRPDYHDANGNEVDAHGRVLLTTHDPVPHYNRGRTYIEPRSVDGSE